MSSSRSFDFPPGFLWGTATASHQVEGANHDSDWWSYEQAGRVPYASGQACRHYELFEHDFDLACSAGQNAHRFSIEWSRVEPREGVAEPRAIAHYRDVLQALRARSLEPVVTLQHFTLPRWVADRGGWANPRTVRWFARYADLVARELGDQVRYWVTINEPTVYVKRAYVVGDWPPCRRRAWLEAFRVFRNMAKAHRAARTRVQAHRLDALVGFAHSAPVIQPCNPARARDRVAAWLRDFTLNRAFFALLRASPRRGPPPFDFLGLNYYTRTVVRGGGPGVIPFAGRECVSPHHADRGAVADTGWEVYPNGLRQTLERFATYGVPLLVTENGVATTDERLRTSFLMAHLSQLALALRDGLDVRGYFYWSLIDNFEWALGTSIRYGLYHVNFTTQERSARPALDRYRAICRSNRVPLDPEPQNPGSPVDECRPGDG